MFNKVKINLIKSLSKFVDEETQKTNEDIINAVETIEKKMKDIKSADDIDEIIGALQTIKRFYKSKDKQIIDGVRQGVEDSKN